MGDIKGMVNMIKDAVPLDKQPELAKRLQEGKFSLRDMYEQFESMQKMGPLSQVLFLSLSLLLLILPLPRCLRCCPTRV